MELALALLYPLPDTNTHKDTHLLCSIRVSETIRIEWVYSRFERKLKLRNSLFKEIYQHLSVNVTIDLNIVCTQYV